MGHKDHLLKPLGYMFYNSMTADGLLVEEVRNVNSQHPLCFLIVSWSYKFPMELLYMQFPNVCRFISGHMRFLRIELTL